MTRRRSTGVLLGTLLLAAAACWPALRGEFQYDDMPAIVLNARAKELSRALDGFGARYASARPLTDVSYALDHAWSGIDPHGYHLTSLALHLAVALLVFALARRLLRRAGIEDGAAPLLTAALFALHPLQSQAVLYLAQRSEVLASLLYLSALLALLEAEERWGTGAGLGWYGLAAASFALALGAKPIAATLPAAFLLVRLGLPGRVVASAGSGTAKGSSPAATGASASGASGSPAPAPRRALAWRPLLLSFPFFLGSAVAAWASLRTTAGRDDAGFDIPSLGPGTYLLTQARVVVRYLWLLFWPAGQNLDYDLQPSRGLLDPPSTVAGLLLLLLLAAGAALAWWRSRARPAEPSARAFRVAAIGFGWYLLVLAPSSSVLPLADLIEEHRPYLANFGLLLAAGAALGAVLEARAAPARRRILAAAVLLCAALALGLHARARVWSSRLSLWTDVVQKSPGKGRAHMNRGHALEQAGRLEEALADYRRALDLSASPSERSSSQSILRWEVLRNLGSTYIKLHRLDEAAAALTEAVALQPGDGDLLSSLAMVSLDRGKLAEAERWSARALQLDPDDGRAENTLGEIRLARGDTTGALQAFRRGAALDPDNAVRAYNTGMAADRLGLVPEACREYARYLRLQAQQGQSDPEVRARLAELSCDGPRASKAGASSR